MERITAERLRGKIVDVHAHVGMSLKAYASGEYPYGDTVEGLYYRRAANGVDLGVVFPLAPELHFDLYELIRTGRLVRDESPVSPSPYALENRMLFTELFDYCPELCDRFIPFVCIDPERDVPAQIDAIGEIADRYPIYGLKVSPVLCQAPIGSLNGPGAPLLDYAARNDIPVIAHVTAHPGERYSQVSDTIEVAARRPDVRFCLAHCAAFHALFLEEAARLDNVWVDTSAIKIQVDAARQGLDFMPKAEERFVSDYSDHRTVMRDLAARYPETIVWGSDSPAYAYIARRNQGDGSMYTFRLKGVFEDEKAALDALDEPLRMQVGSENAIRLLFGAAGSAAPRQP